MFRRTSSRRAKVMAGLAGAAAAIVAGGLTASPAAADGESGKYYSIANPASFGKVLTASGSTSGSSVKLAAYTGSNQQHWTWRANNGDGMRLVNRASKLCLHADFPTAPLKVRDCAEVTGQQFLGAFSPLGKHRLRHVPSKNVLTASGNDVRLTPPAGFEYDPQVFKSTFRGLDPL